MKKYTTILFLLSLLFILSCKDTSPTDGGKPPCPSLRIVALAPYWQPVWHPSGAFIAFGHSPLYKIDSIFNGQCFEGARYFGPGDSSGFWLIDTNGTNERMVFQFRFDRFNIDNPAWSPDGEWLAFNIGAQIYKMRFTGNGFDTTTLSRLSYPGLNSFFPAWSPDGQWIVYDVSLPEQYAGIWIMRTDGSQNHRIFGGAYPTWHPDGKSLLGVIGTGPTSRWTKFVIYYLDGSQANDTLPAIIGNYNRHPRYSPDGTKIAVASQSIGGKGNIWIMNSDNSNPRQLTTEGTTDWLDWSPDGRKIVYVSYRPDDWSYANGTLWTVDVSTGERKQLTFNTPRDSLIK